MKRDLNFVDRGPLSVALGVPPERIEELDRAVNQIIDADGSIRDVVTAMNERGDLTDSEWTGLIFSLGYLDGYQQADAGLPPQVWSADELRGGKVPND